jgi:hypothetical protein
MLFPVITCPIPVTGIYRNISEMISEENKLQARNATCCHLLQK